jgi:hypothetical protein
LLSVAVAAVTRDCHRRLKSLTLLAAPIDFTEAGELTLFIDESEIAFLENMMRQQGFLDSRQMGGVFQLRSKTTHASQRQGNTGYAITTKVVICAGLAKLSKNGTLAVRMMWMISVWVKRI